MKKLPPGWSIATIADITEYLSRGKQPKYVEYSSLPVINQRSIQWSGIQDEYLKYVDPLQFDSWEPERFIQPGDILWNSTGRGTVGRACLVTQKDVEPPKVVDSHVTILRPNQKAINPDFLFAWVRSAEVQNLVERLATGATNQIELGRKAIASINIPVAPLNEQKRIADKLDNLLTRVNECHNRLERIPHILKQFRKSVLAIAVSGELTEDWRIKNPNVGVRTDLFVKIQEKFSSRDPESQESPCTQSHLPENWLYAPVEAVGDVFLGRQRSPKNHSGSYMRPYVRAANITWDGWNLSDVKEMNFDPSDFERFKLKVGDVLINEGSGSADEVGKPAVWNGEIENCCFQNTLICVRPSEDISEYLYFIFLNAAVSKAFVKETRGIGIYHLGKARFAAFRIPIPPLEEQKEIVRRIKHLFAYADRLESYYRKALGRAKKIESAFLSKAFRGELTFQETSDESASTLLEKIRSAKAIKNSSSSNIKKTKVPSPNSRSLLAMLKREDIHPNHLSEILRKGGSMSPENLWSLSKLEIDDFYDQLKEEEEEDLLREVRKESGYTSRLLEAV